MPIEKTDGIRIGNHSGRRNKNGVFRPEHNDRNFDISHAPHINPDKVKDNKVVMFWASKEQKQRNISIDEYELSFYNDLFRKQLSIQNQKHIVSRHKEKVKTMEQFRKCRNYCPEEDIITLGNHDNCVSPEVLWEIAEAYCKYHMATFVQCVLLNVSIHVDEDNAAPHVHLRKVWIAKAKEQIEYERKRYFENPDRYTKKKCPQLPEEDYVIVHQNASLRQMGIERPDPEKPEGRYNNAKQTYSAMCRKKLIELAQERNISLELTPKPSDEVGLNLMKYKLKITEQKLQEVEEKSTSMQEELAEKSDELAALIHTLENPLPVPPKKPMKKLLESESDYEKRISADAKYQAELSEYYTKLEQLPAVQSVRKKMKELEEMKKSLQNQIEEEMQRRTRTFYDKRLLEFIKEIQRIKIPDSEESLYEYYKRTEIKENETLPEHLWNVAEKEDTETKNSHKQQNYTL